MHNYFFDAPPDGPIPPDHAFSSPYGAMSYEDPPVRAPRPRRSSLRKVGFLLALVLLLAGTGVGIFLALHTEFPPLPVLSRPVESDVPALGGGDGVTTIPLPQVSEEPATTVPRAPIGTGVTLALTQEPGHALSLQELYRKCTPSIVGIRAYSSSGGSSGTGVVMTDDGYIITNYHVIQGSYRVEVLLPEVDEYAQGFADGGVYEALLVGGDQSNDLAVLKIDCTGLVCAEFGDSEQLQVGDTALAIGNPLGQDLRNTMTDGIISAINRDVNSDGITMTLIQTTAALNSGNSGGALLNISGQVVGITNMKMTSYYSTVEGIGFAIPTATTKAVVDELIEKGRLTGQPILGIKGYSLTPAAATSQGLQPGVFVQSVDQESGSWKGGMRPGDVITTCNGQSVASVEDINAIKAGFQVGDTLTFQVYRRGQTLELEVVLMERADLDR